MVLGRKNSGEPAVFTIIDLLAGCYLHIRIDSKTTAGVAVAMEPTQRAIWNKFSPFFRSITTNNGNDFAALSAFEALDTQIYSAWERPVNERTNRILHKFIPKWRPIHNYAYEQALMFADEIDAAPRKQLNYCTPE